MEVSLPHAIATVSSLDSKRHIYKRKIETKHQKTCSAPDLFCFSHLRWDFVFQRPQHLMSRFAKERRVFYFEEPVFGAGPAQLLIRQSEEDVIVVTPSIPNGTSLIKTKLIIAELLQQLMILTASKEYIFWYYTPMALEISRNLHPQTIIYDCMDELSNFKGASPELAALEKELFLRASVVFTGGESLYQAKKNQHTNIYAVPSSIEKDHFELARQPLADPLDQKDIPRPRFGFYGVIDERFDVSLLNQIAMKRPDWHFIVLGPVVKIDQKTLPRQKNIHYLSGKSYSELPQYLSNWDVAIMPFAINASTKYISPTKTPEFLAGGKPVVSTAITDVITPYGVKGLVSIAYNADEFISGCEKALTQRKDQMFTRKVDNYLKDFSWDKTWNYMNDLVKSSEAFAVDSA